MDWRREYSKWRCGMVRTDKPTNLTIHRLASRAKPPGVSSFRVERAPSGEIRYVQIDENGIEYDEHTKAVLREAEKRDFKRPWWKF